MQAGKVRWALDFREPVAIPHTALEQQASAPGQDDLFGGIA